MEDFDYLVISQMGIRPKYNVLKAGRISQLTLLEFRNILEATLEAAKLVARGEPTKASHIVDFKAFRYYIGRNQSVIVTAEPIERDFDEIEFSGQEAISLLTKILDKI